MGKTYSLIFFLAVLAGLLVGVKALGRPQSAGQQPVANSSEPTPSPTSFPSPTHSANQNSPRKFVSLFIKGQELSVEVARSPEEIQTGLSNRLEIGSDGMLFVFSSPQTVQFWMKDMFFPLDIVWIQRGKITGISANIPPPSPGVSDDSLTTYPSPGSVEFALEVPAGTSSQLGIALGDPITIQ